MASAGAYPVPAGNRIHQILPLKHCVARIWTEGGDRYPTYGADQSDRLLSQDRSRKRGPGTPGIRCPRGSCESTPEISELPHQPEAGITGCGHRDQEKGEQGTGLTRSLLVFYAFLRFKNQSHTQGIFGIRFLPRWQRWRYPIFSILYTAASLF